MKLRTVRFFNVLILINWKNSLNGHETFLRYGDGVLDSTECRFFKIYFLSEGGEVKDDDDDDEGLPEP